MGDKLDHELPSNLMKLCLIQVPYMLGDESHRASRGPEQIVNAFAAPLDCIRIVKRVEHDESFRNPVEASLAVNLSLAQTVREVIGDGQFPLVLAGSCDVSKGILSGFDHARCGVVWIDAHGDFNTPESTLSGFFAGMSLAVITGDCYRDHWAKIGNSDPIPEANIVMLGVRDLDPPERRRLEDSAIQVVEWNRGRPTKDFGKCLDDLSSRVDEVYLHIDLDAFDPEVAPGIVDPPVPGGLSLQQMKKILREVKARFRIKSAAVTTYNPELDQNGKTLQAVIETLRVLIEQRN